MAKRSLVKKSATTRKRIPRKKTVKKYDFYSLPLMAIGEKKNYNLIQFTQYHVSTIEYVVSEKRYHARVGFTGSEGYVFFNSYHEDFSDAEHTINFVKEGKSTGSLYNIFGETIAVNTSPTLGQVTEVLSLIYSFVIDQVA